ncbi:MAG: N-acetyltransferase [Bacteroidaceae bacterium]|nr:N-acetyltransferase [Bacteroidaceae bacterium]MBQ5840130.1 N-acetyltransferase [Bacteroidaceae bacterium]
MYTSKHITSKGTIYAMEDEREMGYITYEISNDVMTITHTIAHVEKRGVGQHLVLAAIEYAKQENLKIHPQCSYARALMNRDEELRKMMV